MDDYDLGGKGFPCSREARGLGPLARQVFRLAGFMDDYDGGGRSPREVRALGPL